MRAEARPPRARWPFVLLGVLIVAAIIVAVIGAFALRVPTSAPTPRPTHSASGKPEDTPTGCLVPGRNLTMLLTTQKEAGHNQAGAVEFAAALLKWLHQYPNPSAEDAATAQKNVMARTAKGDLVTVFASDPNSSGGLVPDETDFHVTTALGKYRVDSYSPEKAVVVLNGAIYVNGAINPQLVPQVSYTLAWEGGRWKYQSASTVPADALATTGQAFAGGC